MEIYLHGYASQQPLLIHSQRGKPMESAGAVRVECGGFDLIDFHLLVPLQGELKSLSAENYERLKRVILELGFSSPFHVWADGDTPYILDGTQRYRTLSKMAEEGFEIPPLPYVKVDAKDKREAMRKLLALASQYGKVEAPGLYEFMTTAEIDINDLMMANNFPDLNLQHFAAEYFEGWETDFGSDKIDNTEPNLDGITAIIKIICPQEKKDEIVEFLKLNIVTNSVSIEA